MHGWQKLRAQGFPIADASNYKRPRHSNLHRELYKTLGYNEWRNFRNVVMKRAMKACEENGRAVADHFVQSYKAIIAGKGAKQEVTDILLSRYAAYLVVKFV